jgi:hypothetical protein
MDNPATLPIVDYSGTASEDVQEYWLDAAWRALQREDRGLVARITAGDLDGDTVADVVYAAARRVLRNPDGVESESGGVDDFTESWKRADATQDIYFTAAELRRLLPVESATTGFVGSIKYC